MSFAANKVLLPTSGRALALYGYTYREGVMKLIPIILGALMVASCSSSPPKPSERLANLEDLEEFWVDLKKSKNEAISIEERKYAVASWVYSAVADRTYLEPETLCFPLDEKWINIKISEGDFEELLKNGFFAQAWHRTSSRGDNELVIAYRGTDGPDDFRHGNFSFMKSPFSNSQFESAIKFRDLIFQVADNNEKLNYDYVVFVGHSLGGGLAQYAQDFTPNSRAFVFNSSPNRGRLYSIFKKHESKKYVTRLYEKGEVLRWPRWLLFDFDRYDNSNPGGLGMNTRWFQFYKDNLIENHNMKDFSAALTKLAAVAGDAQAAEAIDFLKQRRKGNKEAATENCSIRN
ncbi:MAG: hypothetical protein ACFE0K_15300 [Alcanivorax sp.]|uniref:hypothetical protein n=1 Tax=Alcanivorax sp. TaxID=1872427 RepID=UPI003DA76AA8